MTLHRFVGPLVVCGLLALFPDPVAAISPQGAQAIKNLRSWLDGMHKLKQKAQKYFDGKNILPGVDSAKTMNLVRDMMFKRKYVIRGYKKISKEDRASPECKAIVKEFRELSLFIKALDNAGKSKAEGRRS